MSINNPWAALLFVIIPFVSFLKKRVKRATILVPSIDPIKQVNTKFRYKHRDLAFMLRFFELAFLAIAAMDIKNFSAQLNQVILAVIVLEIFLKNTFWRTLP